MAVARPVRFLGALSVVLLFFLIYQYLRPTPSLTPPNAGPVEGNGAKIDNMERDPLLDAIGEPDGPLWRHTDNDYSPNSLNSARINATLLSLVRNQELSDLLPTMRQLEETWNHKFNYPWTFFNDVPFTDEFKLKTQEATKAQCSYHIIPKEHWEMPPWVSQELFDESAKILKENNVQYAGK
ncbi:putative mannosyltransferase ktr4, partial [Exophiala xenobiotica]